MKVSEVSKKYNITIDTLRYYEKIGLIKNVPRDKSGIRNYDEKSLKQKIINLCGHAHTLDRFADFDKGLIYHCEVDAHDNKPVLLDDIIQEIKTKVRGNNEKQP